MKRSLFRVKCIVAAMLVMLSTAAMAGGGSKQKNAAGTKNIKQSSTPDCLEICAQAVWNGEAQKGVTMVLYCGNEEVMRIDSTEFSKVYFTLKRDRNYTVQISKDGFVPRLVSISTYVPSSVPLKPIFRFEFEVEMLEQVKGEDNFYIDFPVALVSFNKSKDCFEHSRKYTSRIKREIAKENKATMAIKE